MPCRSSQGRRRTAGLICRGRVVAAGGPERKAFLASPLAQERAKDSNDRSSATRSELFWTNSVWTSNTAGWVGALVVASACSMRPARRRRPARESPTGRSAAAIDQGHVGNRPRKGSPAAYGPSSSVSSHSIPRRNRVACVNAPSSFSCLDRRGCKAALDHQSTLLAIEPRKTHRGG